MKQKTPLALLEQWVNEELDHDITTFAILAKIQELKEVEKDMVMNAMSHGWSYCANGILRDKLNYFNETFEQ